MKYFWTIFLSSIILTGCKKDFCVDDPSYNINASNEASTIFLDSIVVDQYKLYIPKYFTPNGDSLNDGFKTYSPDIDSVDNFLLKVFDDCSEQFFETNDTRGVWDGTYKGIVMPAGIYIYELSAQFEGKPMTNKSGEFQLIRY